MPPHRPGADAKRASFPRRAVNPHYDDHQLVRRQGRPRPARRVAAGVGGQAHNSVRSCRALTCRSTRDALLDGGMTDRLARSGSAPCCDRGGHQSYRRSGDDCLHNRRTLPNSCRFHYAAMSSAA
jgi:hypothetical protein